MAFSFLKMTTVLSILMLGAATSSLAEDITGAGATFPHPIYAKWAEAYRKEKSIGLNYQAIGSGGGIKQIKAKTVTFGASDMPLKAEELEKEGLIQWPMIIGGVVPVVNVRGVGVGQMVLDGPVLARIYLGEVKNWDDPSIKNLNPNLKLPHELIVQVYRADGSGTNFLFTHYLSAVSDKFQETIGAESSVQWPAGIGAKGNEGVSNMTVRTEGAIGYVEYAYALQNKMIYVNMVNKDGKKTSPNIDSFQAAAANADWGGSKGFYLVLTDQPGAGSWPITGASFILMRKEPLDVKASRQALDFFAWAYKNGDDMAKTLNYVPMPSKAKALVEKSWEQIGLKK
jgi:phosphate transport system substrate-binding protein